MLGGLSGAWAMKINEVPRLYALEAGITGRSPRSAHAFEDTQIYHLTCL